jgi:hypothetical protein
MKFRALFQPFMMGKSRSQTADHHPFGGGGGYRPGYVYPSA